MKYETMGTEANEFQEIREAAAETERISAAEISEQMEMDAIAGVSVSIEELREQMEMDEGAEKMGYSSDYYEHEMASALESGNKIAYENAKDNWSKAKVKEETKLGYSSDYHEHQMASALESGNKIAYENEKRKWAEAKVKEELKR